MNLTQIKPGLQGRVVDLKGPDFIVERLREIGFYKGAEVALVRRSLFKGPLICRISNTVLALRGAEAECVLVQVES